MPGAIPLGLPSVGFSAIVLPRFPDPCWVLSSTPDSNDDAILERIAMGSPTKSREIRVKSLGSLWGRSINRCHLDGRMEWHL